MQLSNSHRQKICMAGCKSKTRSVDLLAKFSRLLTHMKRVDFEPTTLHVMPTGCLKMTGKLSAVNVIVHCSPLHDSYVAGTVYSCATDKSNGKILVDFTMSDLGFKVENHVLDYLLGREEL